jgi:hypothetical protein
VGTFADNIAIMAVHEDPILASGKLQEHIILPDDWLLKCKIAVNEMKLCNVTFSLRKEKCSAVKINQIDMPQTTSARYLGLHLANKLTW